MMNNEMNAASWAGTAGLAALLPPARYSNAERVGTGGSAAERGWPGSLPRVSVAYSVCASARCKRQCGNTLSSRLLFLHVRIM